MPNSSAFIVSETPLPPKASNIVHKHWVDCVSPLCFESTACPLPSVGCLYAPTFLRRLCVDYLSSSTATPPADYTWKPRAPPKTRVPYNLEHRVYHPSSYRLLHLLPSACRLLVRVDYSLYQHLLEIQCAIEHIYNEYGLWTADTWAMSADAQLCDSGQWTPRDRRWQFWPCIPEVWTPHGEDRMLYCEPYITYLRPCNLDEDSDL